MRIKIGNGLLLINLLAILTIIVILFFPSPVLRIILGIPLLLFSPGYTLMTALFARQRRLDSIEWVALSLGTSIAVIVLIVLFLNYTPWGINLETVLYSVVAFILIASLVSWFRQIRLPKEERANIEFHLRLPGWGAHLKERILSVILILVILGSFGIMGYLIAAPKVWETFTEFYILGIEGEVSDYPERMTVGEEGEVTAGIINHERDTVTYQIEVRIGEVKNNEIGPIILEHEEQSEVSVSFTPQKIGENQRVDFWLLKNGKVDADLEPLRFWIDVAK